MLFYFPFTCEVSSDQILAIRHCIGFFQEEIAVAVHSLKSEYEKVEITLRKHNSTLEAMVEKLQIDREIAVKRQQSLENQLRAAQNELEHNKRDSSDLSQLQLEFSRVKNQALTDRNKIKTFESELELKDQALLDLRKTLDIVRLENKELTTLLAALHDRQERLVAGDIPGLAHETIAEVTAGFEMESSGTKDVDSVMVERLLKENAGLKQRMDQMNSLVKHPHMEHTATIEQPHHEKSKFRQTTTSESKEMVRNKVAQEIENNFLQEKEELQRQITELKIALQRRDSSPSSANLCNASAMTDQVRWNQSGLMGVVQRQKEEIDNLKSECAKLKLCSKSPSISPGKIPPEIKPRQGKLSPKSPLLSPDTIDLLKTTNAENLGQMNDQSKEHLLPFVCKRCSNPLSPLKLRYGNQARKSNIETQTIEGCESPAHTSKCSSPRHSWNKKVRKWNHILSKLLTEVIMISSTSQHNSY